jgi:GNAT superfamily N-acetyltransferase
VSLVFREARLPDVGELFDVRAATRENAIPRERLAQMGITPDSVSAALASGATRGWVSLDGPRIVGFCLGASASGEVLVLAVLPEYERRGVGKALLSLVVDWLWSFGPKTMWLAAAPDPRGRAHGFYRHLGWRPTGETDANGDEILTLPPPTGSSPRREPA